MAGEKDVRSWALNLFVSLVNVPLVSRLLFWPYPEPSMMMMLVL